MIAVKVPSRPFGFTMVELIVVIVVMGILGAIGIGRLMDRKSLDTRAYADQVKNVLRYAQKIAIAQQRPIYIVSDSDKIAACYTTTCGAGDLVPAAGGENSRSSATDSACGNAGWLCEGRPKGVSATSFDTFFFNAAGIPSFNATSSITLTGEGSYTVTVEAGTGYVH